MKLTFNGAARIVTGSCYLLEAAGQKILVDCGMFQGAKDVTRRNYEPFGFNPREISCLLLTHAHIDHSGLIPKLVKGGFRGRIIATPPTIDLVKIMLEDSAQVNEDDTKHENKRRLRMDLPPREPLYTLKDVKASFGLFRPVVYDSPFSVNGAMEMTFRDAGHILGSAIIELTVSEAGKTRKLVFSGDLGQWDTPLLDNPTLIEDADYVLIESTYGDRLHGDIKTRGDLLSEVVRETFGKGGKLLIPSFAVERTQELLYYLHKLSQDKELPAESVFLDSPLAIDATKVFSRNMSYFSDGLRKEFKEPFAFKSLKPLRTSQDSQTMNEYPKPCMIIAGNGMCTGGRIRYHLKYHLWKPQNTILFVGYQAEGSLGRIILEGAKTVKMMGLEVAVKADVRQIDSFSSHADSKELIKWACGFKQKPKKIFVVHGEEASSLGLEKTLDGLGFTTHVPVLGETVTLD
jgi:metallo-beta-lactamase family protein